MLGRATFPVPSGQNHPLLPDDLRRVRVVERPLQEDTLVVVEGEDLPRWESGVIPYHFSSLEELQEYRAESRSWESDVS